MSVSYRYTERHICIIMVPKRLIITCNLSVVISIHWKLHMVWLTLKVYHIIWGFLSAGKTLVCAL